MFAKYLAAGSGFTVVSRHWQASRRHFSSLRPRGNDGLIYNGHSYPFPWLRDACQCPSCLHPSTLQKLHRTSDVPLVVKPRDGGVRVSDDGVHVTWDSGHQSLYPAEFLKHYASCETTHAFHRDVDKVEWDAEHLKSARDLFLPYEALATPSDLLAAITQLTRYGLLFVSAVPNERTSNEECELRNLGQRFGELRTTFYGETWDVKNVKNSRNIAYTNVDLGLHMDLLYFQHPPRFQILHCLRNRVDGGKSIFVDAAHVASKLRAEDTAAFDILASTPVAFHYINDGHHLHYSHPTIQLSRFPGDASVEFVNYSPPFQAPLSLQTPSAFYPALKRFASMLDDPTVQYEHLLREGDAVLFDNRRVLHSRTAFREREGENSADGDANRWLKGCYLEADAVLDRGRVLREQLEKDSQ
ncbi:Clavaminate synthase-like protein [Trametes versicolor FP-101664 SS1]|uniref:Clavaminate synthase-like protein n=1 Tax=Trametes versicolor (strain FP-101664) TaxID=717944 RepID=R7S8M7_TRAVS|nr:Clavaminate synthase-like protein [Trametes versicolor FP-101664 SS1]EIW52040.1 Clavaminate synthase-like protein [Trametes versicolor FP-101664 SS1]